VTHPKAIDLRFSVPNLAFVKMHGIGNDYIYLDAVGDPAIEAINGLPQLARSMSDRHAGIGADGLILVCQPTADGRSAGAHVRMRMFNADGSESAMCGNGIRCVAKFAHDRLNHTGRSITVETATGLVEIALTQNALGRVETASVDMGEPILEAGRIPVAPVRGLNNDGCAIDVPADQLAVFAAGIGFSPDSVEPSMTCVSMGNPHVVLWCKDPWAVPLQTVGPLIENDSMFPRRVNAHFAATSSKGRVVMRTWERGSGITQACGTGACAVVVAGVLTGRLARSVRVALPGGELDVDWDEATNRVRMTGPAHDICTGTWPTDQPPRITVIPTLTTQRLTLRPFTHADAAEVARLAGDKRISDTTLTVPHPYKPEHAVAWISTHTISHTLNVNTVWAIKLAATGELVGAIGAVYNRHNSAEIGYWIGVQHWSRGYASEASLAVLRYAFEQRQPPLQRVDAHHFLGNDASGRVMQKTGMTFEGNCLSAALKHGKPIDVARYAITREQWLAQQSATPSTAGAGAKK